MTSTIKTKFAGLAVVLAFLAPSLTFAQETTTYTVKAGDTLSEIAETHNTTVEKLAELNNIENTEGFWRVIYNLSIATYSSTTVGWHYTIINAFIYLLLIVGFTYFYTYATFNPAEISSTIKQNGGFIPGIRAGKPTTEYLTNVLTKITLFGALFLAAIAVIPMLARGVGLNTAFGGTSILIVVGVAIELGDQLKSQLVMRHYKGFLEK